MTKKKETVENEGLVDKVIDGYRVKRLKGAGAFVKVYDVRDDDLPNSPVAMQVAQPGCEALLEAGKSLLDRLHGGPGIPEALRYEPADEQGPARLFMTYFEKSVKDIMDAQKKAQFPSERRLYWNQAVDIAIQVLGSLGYVHEKGETHRDVKPSNVMTNDKKTFYLIDFNLADKVVEEARKKQKGKKKKGSVIFSGGLNLSGDVLSVGDINLSCAGGTPGYMSPEQQTRRSSEVSQVSDIYNVGAMLYHMVTGELALGRFSKASELNPEVPEWGDEVLDKFLAKKAKNRYQTVDEAISDLEKGLRGEFDKEEKVVPKKEWTDDLYKDLGKLGKGIGSIAWSVTKYTVGLPFTFAAKCFKEAEKSWSDGDTFCWNALGGSIVVAGLSLYLSIGGTYLDNSRESKLRDELKNTGLKGKIAAVERNVVHYIDAEKSLEDSTKTTRIQTGLDWITSLIWSADGKGFYFIGKEKEGNASVYRMDLEGNKSIVVDVTKHGIMPSDTPTRLLDSKKEGDTETILLKYGEHVYFIRADGKENPRRSVKITPDMFDTQDVSPDGKYKLGIDGTNDVEIVRTDGKGDVDVMDNPVRGHSFKSPVWYFERIAEAKEKIEEEKAEKKVEEKMKTRHPHMNAEREAELKQKLEEKKPVQANEEEEKSPDLIKTR